SRLRRGFGRGSLDGRGGDGSERASAGPHAVAAVAVSLASDRLVPRQGGGGLARRVRRPRGQGGVMATRIETVLPPVRARAPPCALVVFGATGDLTHRKLMPALYNLEVNGSLPEAFVTLGTSRREQSGEEFRNEMRSSVGEHSRRPLDPQVWSRFAGHLA